jgi:hypothetical protein
MAQSWKEESITQSLNLFEKNVQLSFCCPKWKDTSFEKDNIIKFGALKI